MNNFVFKFVSVLLFIEVILAVNPTDEITIEVYGNEKSFSERFEQAMKKTDEVTAKIEKIGIAGKAFTILPEIGGAVSESLSFIVSSVTEDMWKDALYQNIIAAIGQSYAENEISGIDAHLRTISQQFYQLYIYTKFMEIMNLYSSENFIFRKYPQFAVAPFKLISLLLKLFKPLSEKYLPNISSAKFLTCHFQDLVLEYRELHVFRRITAMQIKDDSGNFLYAPVPRENDNSSSFVLNQHYNPNGYNTRGFLHCRKYIHIIRPVGLPSQIRSFLIDQDSNHTVDQSDSEDSCAVEYKQLVRHRIEEVYDKLITSMNDMCPSSLRSQRKPTNFGRLTITFTTAYGETIEPSGKKCDAVIFDGLTINECDLYVNFKIDDKQDYSTKVHEGSSVSFDEMHRTKRVSKNQRYTLSLRDEDSDGTYETLASETGTFDDFASNVHNHMVSSHDNYFHFVTQWSDEFEDSRG